ncbi:hypothetical protein DPMN_161319 [Dreissena polymorpha]|uniref:Uncharacterized protein n=1 Tax=Dreissena polymorpha TaxID=45954 RepID=A0A9D4ISK5_DREPO|nr:hypothetical protein DPMN_161319 [Dreissena polymorpha]
MMTALGGDIGLLGYYWLSPELLSGDKLAFSVGFWLHGRIFCLASRGCTAAVIAKTFVLSRMSPCLILAGKPLKWLIREVVA